MPLEFKLPDLGEGIHEGEVLKVLVSVGDEVKEGDSILEIETDKATVDIPSPFTGTVREIRAKEGETASVGDVLMIFDSGEASETMTEKPVEKPTAEKPAEKTPEIRPTPAKTPTKTLDEPPADRTKGPVPASPATRRLARELGVDLRRVAPTGPGDWLRPMMCGHMRKKARPRKDRRSARPRLRQAEGQAPAAQD